MNRPAWTDRRLDDLNGKVDRIDRRVDDLSHHMDERFDAMNARMDSRFDAMNARFDALQRTMFQAAVAMTVAFLTAGAAIVATQL